MTRILIAAAATMLATAASAQESSLIVEAAPTARVSYADLNLHSAAGRTRMEHRIRSAAERICISYAEWTTIVPQQNECYRVAVASGMTQLDALAS